MADRYQITFDMDTNMLKELYHGNNPNNAYNDIKKILEKYHFTNIQGSVYVGDEGISEAHGTMAIQELTAKYDWFNPCISNIKFYRIENELNAQFISDAVYASKQRFNQRIEKLKQDLKLAGLTEEAINNILKEQKFEFEQINEVTDVIKISDKLLDNN